MVSVTPVCCLTSCGNMNGGNRQYTCSEQASLPELVPLKILFGNPEKTSPDVRDH